MNKIAAVTEARVEPTSAVDMPDITVNARETFEQMTAGEKIPAFLQ